MFVLGRQERVELDGVSIEFQLESEVTDGAGIHVVLDIGAPRPRREAIAFRRQLECNRMARPPYLACVALDPGNGHAVLRAYFPLAQYSADERAALLRTHIATALALRREVGVKAP